MTSTDGSSPSDRPSDRYDLCVIGAGSGGVRAARMASNQGKRVCIIEARDLGGTCVHRGCVPKKLLVYASRFAQNFYDAPAYGWQLTKPTFDWATLRDNKDEELARLGGLYAKGLENSGVEVLRGYGHFVGPNEVAIRGEDERTIQADRFLISVGGRPIRPDVEGAEHLITSDEVFHLDTLPKRIVIIGGGYIGVEFACLFNLLGVETHLVHRSQRILRGFDEETVDFLMEQIRLLGVHLHLGRSLSRITKDEAGLHAHLDDGQTLTGDVQLAATGRAPYTAELGLDKAGVACGDDGSVIVDDDFTSSQPHIFALGDVIRRLELTPVAIAEAIRFVRLHLCDETADAAANTSAKEETPGDITATQRKAVDYAVTATAIFSTPTFATVGLTEEHAWSRGHEVKVFSSTFRPMKQTLSGRAGRSFMKLVVCAQTDKVLGVHVVGPEAGEIVQGFAVALHCGATKADLDGTIGIHPTAAEELVQMREPTRAARR